MAFRRSYGARAAGKDHSFYRAVQDGDFVEREDLAEDIQFTQTPSDELGHLGTEVEDNDFFRHLIQMFPDTNLLEN